MGIHDGKNAEIALFRAELADLLAIDRDLLSSWEAELIESLAWRDERGLLVDGLAIDERQVAKVHHIWERMCG